jgi:hypothetical protein
MRIRTGGGKLSYRITRRSATRWNIRSVETSSVLNERLRIVEAERNRVWAHVPFFGAAVTSVKQIYPVCLRTKDGEYGSFDAAAEIHAHPFGLI